MDCTREEMMKDQNLELAYIAGCLDGNIKPREFLKENPIELKDVVCFKATYNKELKANRQQKRTEDGLAPGHYKVVNVNGDDIKVEHVDGTGGTFNISRRDVRTIEKGAADNYLRPQIVQPARNKRSTC